MLSESGRELAVSEPVATKEYVVKLGYKICNYSGSSRYSAETSFTLTLKNPCHNSSKAKITSPTLDNYTYVVKSPKTTTTSAHKDFTLTTSPATHTLCGSLKYKVTDAANAVIGSTGKPIFYTSGTKKFTFESTDTTLYKVVKTYTITASLASYQTSTTASTSTATFTVTYKDPCEDPFTFVATAQTGMTYAFTGVEATKKISPFTITPSDCPFTYSCSTGVAPKKSPLRGTETSPACNTSLFDPSPSSLLVKIKAGETEYKAKSRTPGTITVNICGTGTRAKATSTKQKVCTNFVITLTDPCDAPSAFTKPAGLSTGLTHVIS